MRPDRIQPLLVSLTPFVSLSARSLFFKFPELASLYSKKTSAFSCVRALHLHFFCLENSTLRPLYIWLLFILRSVLCLWSLWSPYLREPLLPPLVIPYHIALLLFFTTLSVISWGGAMFTLQRPY